MSNPTTHYADLHTTELNNAAGQSALGRLLGRLSRGYAQWQLKRQTKRELSELDNAELKDLGICRGDIHHIATQTAVNPNYDHRRSN